jgi:hypothetical protein
MGKGWWRKHELPRLSFRPNFFALALGPRVLAIHFSPRQARHTTLGVFYAGPGSSGISTYDSFRNAASNTRPLSVGGRLTPYPHQWLQFLAMHPRILLDTRLASSGSRVPQLRPSPKATPTYISSRTSPQRPSACSPGCFQDTLQTFKSIGEVCQAHHQRAVEAKDTGTIQQGCRIQVIQAEIGR